MDAIENALVWLIGIGVAIMIAGVIVMRFEKRKKD